VNCPSSEGVNYSICSLSHDLLTTNAKKPIKGSEHMYFSPFLKKENTKKCFVLSGLYDILLKTFNMPQLCRHPENIQTQNFPNF